MGVCFQQYLAGQSYEKPHPTTRNCAWDFFSQLTVSTYFMISPCIRDISPSIQAINLTAEWQRSRLANFPLLDQCQFEAAPPGRRRLILEIEAITDGISRKPRFVLTRYYVHLGTGPGYASVSMLPFAASRTADVAKTCRGPASTSCTTRAKRTTAVNVVNGIVTQMAAFADPFTQRTENAFVVYGMWVTGRGVENDQAYRVRADVHNRTWLDAIRQ